MRKIKYVYFIKPCGMDGPIKIGCSEEPERRLKTLATWSPFPLEIIGKVEGECSDENFLHRRFADLHTHREWFQSSPLLRDTIRRILAGEPVESACTTLPIVGSIRIKRSPPKDADRVLFLDYGRKIKKATENLWRKQDNHYPPGDVCMIMHNWRRDVVNDHLPIIPTPEQIARLDEFISNPIPHCIERPWIRDKNRMAA